MKLAVLAKPFPGAPASQKHLKANLRSGKLDCAYQAMGGGRVAIANADSAEELWQDLLSHPLSSRFTYHVERTADTVEALEIGIKGLPGWPAPTAGTRERSYHSSTFSENWLPPRSSVLTDLGAGFPLQALGLWSFPAADAFAAGLRCVWGSRGLDSAVLWFYTRRVTKNPICKGLRILWERFTRQGIRTTALWAVDHAVRLISGANIPHLSQITPQLHVGGQFRRRGWHRLTARGVTAVVNMRRELDDRDLGIAPARYLYLPTADDQAPSLGQLREGVAFIEHEIAQGGGVYIHCGAGVGRAATMAAAYLVHRGLTPEEAWARVRQVRPFVRPTAAQIAQLELFAEEA